MARQMQEQQEAEGDENLGVLLIYLLKKIRESCSVHSAENRQFQVEL